MKKIYLLSAFLFLYYQGFSAIRIPLKVDKVSVYSLHVNQRIPFNGPVRASFNASDWIALGGTNVNSAPYDFYYYKLIQVNANSDTYGSILEVSIQGDVNYSNDQGTFQILVNKWVNTTARFDGVEITCISGNPSAAIFYIYNNAVWVRSVYKWGSVFYRTVVNFNGNPLVGAPFGQTTAAPVGYLTSTSTYGIKCDFDNSRYYQLPYHDTYGNMFVEGNLWIGSQPVAGVTTNAINIAGKTKLIGTVNSYSTGTDANQPTIYRSGVNNGTYPFNNYDNLILQAGIQSRDILFVTGADPTANMIVKGSGNVGIGTDNPTSELSVNGQITAKQVKVTQTGWPDFVFDSTYQLKSLTELKTYISLNRHLPDIHSAKEISEGGNDLGQTDAKLLQKIEELTLYIIRQNERIEALEKKVQILNRK